MKTHARRDGGDWLLNGADVDHQQLAHIAIIWAQTATASRGSSCPPTRRFRAEIHRK